MYQEVVHELTVQIQKQPPAPDTIAARLLVVIVRFAIRQRSFADVCNGDCMTDTVCRLNPCRVMVSSILTGSQDRPAAVSSQA